MQMMAICQRCADKLGESCRITAVPGREPKGCSLCGQSGTVCEIMPINQPRCRRPALWLPMDKEKANRRRQWA